MQRVSIADFKSVQKNTLQGFFTLNYGPLRVRDCSFHIKDGKPWFSFPARKVEKSDGTSSWVAFVVIEDREHLSRLQAHVCGLLREAAGGEAAAGAAGEAGPDESFGF